MMFLCRMFAFFCTLSFFPLLAAEPSSLDAVNPAKLPPNLRPAKGMPKEVLATLGQRGDKIDTAAFRPDGKQLLLGGPDQIVRVWDLEKMRLSFTLRHTHPVVCLAYTSDGKQAAIGDANGNVRLCKIDGGNLVTKLTFLAHKDAPIWSVAFAPDSNKLYTAARAKEIGVWDITKAKPIQVDKFSGHDTEARSMSLDSNATVLASAGNQDMHARVWDLAGSTPKLTSLKLGGRVVSVALAPDGKTLAVGGAKGIPALYDYKDHALTKAHTLDTDDRAATSLNFAPDGTRIVGAVALSATEDRVVVWDRKGTKLHEFTYDLHLHFVAFAPDGRHLLVITEAEPLLIRLPK